MENEFPKALYRTGSEFEWDGRGTDSLTVADAAEQEQAEADGWAEAADYLASESGKTLLDKPAKDIEPALADLSLDELERLKADETAGKSRKGVLGLIDAEIEKKLAA